ncbi:hypothetical protein L0P10_20785, partial [Eggerthella lenta]|nr:hypothetical protein [Eggerthella lenta]
IAAHIAMIDRQRDMASLGTRQFWSRDIARNSKIWIFPLDWNHPAPNVNAIDSGNDLLQSAIAC